MKNNNLARWHQLPEIELYMDQMISYIEDQVSRISFLDEKLITPSMVNNYVKLGLIPKPNKKKYNKEHLAFLISITILKQVLPISMIKLGIDQTIKQHGHLKAYNLFCDTLEHTIDSHFDLKVEDDYLLYYEKQASLYFACVAFVSKNRAIQEISGGKTYEK